MAPTPTRHPEPQAANPIRKTTYPTTVRDAQPTTRSCDVPGETSTTTRPDDNAESCTTTVTVRSFPNVSVPNVNVSVPNEGEPDSESELEGSRQNGSGPNQQVSPLSIHQRAERVNNNYGPSPFGTAPRRQGYVNPFSPPFYPMYSTGQKYGLTFFRFLKLL